MASSRPPRHSRFTTPNRRPPPLPPPPPAPNGAGAAEESVRLLSELTTLATREAPIGPVRTVQLVARPGEEALALGRRIALWLVQRGLRVLVGEEHLLTNLEEEARALAGGGGVAFWSRETDLSAVDLVVSMGGDGTVLYCSNLYQGRVPPIVALHMGSLGFLTVFQASDFPSILGAILDGAPQRVNLRMRLKATVHRGGGYEVVRGVDEAEGIERGVRKIPLAGGARALDPVGEYTQHVLNEVVVDRGANPTMLTLDLYAGDLHLTTMLADGLVVATPTGSTAYNLSAGGALVHPDKAAVLVTPICPHSLTARPMVLPPNVDLRVCVSLETRSTAWISFDGRERVEVLPGDEIRVRASRHPCVTVCSSNGSSSDWFTSLVSSLGWNQRKKQKGDLALVNKL